MKWLYSTPSLKVFLAMLGSHYLRPPGFLLKCFAPQWRQTSLWGVFSDQALCLHLPPLLPELCKALLRFEKSRDPDMTWQVEWWEGGGGGLNWQNTWENRAHFRCLFYHHSFNLWTQPNQTFSTYLWANVFPPNSILNIRLPICPFRSGYYLAWLQFTTAAQFILFTHKFCWIRFDWITINQYFF